MNKPIAPLLDCLADPQRAVDGITDPWRPDDPEHRAPEHRAEELRARVRTCRRHGRG
ncbi:MAG: hypothetical protein QM676_01365 [Novosphingobium sp.]